MPLIILKSFVKKVQNEKCYAISCIKSDHVREFENHDFENFVITLV